MDLQRWFHNGIGLGHCKFVSLILSIGVGICREVIARVVLRGGKPKDQRICQASTVFKTVVDGRQ